MVERARGGFAASTASSRRSGLNGLRIAALDNSKANADYLLDMILKGIQAEIPVKSVLSLRKLNPSLGAPGEILDQLEKDADFVVSAMAD